MRHILNVVVLVAVVSLCLPGSARAATLWTTSYSYLGTGGSTIWTFDTAGGTLTEEASYGFLWVQSMADTGAFLYVTAYDGAQYSVHQIDRGTFGILSTTPVVSLGIPPASTGSTPRLSGMTYDGSDLWGMDFDGVAYRLQLDAAGAPVGSTAVTIPRPTFKDCFLVRDCHVPVGETLESAVRVRFYFDLFYVHFHSQYRRAGCAGRQSQLSSFPCKSVS